MKAATRMSWCPGALRPMASGDGLLLRVKSPGGSLSLDQAAGLARLAGTCGNGHLDLTGRGNLQVRGVSDRTLAALQHGLDAIGLLDADPDIEAVRNIVASPLAGLDPDAVDVRPMVAALEHHLAADPVFRLMPPKWSIVVDGGGSIGLDHVPADVRFVYSAPGSLFVQVGRAWATLAPNAMRNALTRIAGFVARHRPARMRDLLDVVGTPALFRAAGLRQTDAPPSRPQAIAPQRLLGMQAGNRFVGAAPPFGSVTAEALSRMVEAAGQAGGQEIRVTPWRSMLVVLVPQAAPACTADDADGCSPLVRGLGAWSASLLASPVPSRVTLGHCVFPHDRKHVEENAARLVRQLEHLGMIIDPSDPRLGVVACTGAPGCHRATVATRADAARLAGASIREGGSIGLHVSGCSKGCARPAATAWTLVGRDGRYDLVLDGRAGDSPAVRGLTCDEATAWLRDAMPAEVA